MHFLTVTLILMFRLPEFIHLATAMGLFLEVMLGLLEFRYHTPCPPFNKSFLSPPPSPKEVDQRHPKL